MQRHTLDLLVVRGRVEYGDKWFADEPGMEWCSIRQGISVLSVFVSNIENRGRGVKAQAGYRFLVRESADDDEQALVAKIQARHRLRLQSQGYGVDDEGISRAYLSRSLGTKGKVSS